MAGDKRELILDLLARDRTGPATASASRHVKDVGDAAEKASKSADKLSHSNETASDKANDLGDEAKGAANDLQKLEREIKETTGELVLLARAFAQTDDAAQRLDLSKSIRKAENDIRRLTKSKGIIGKSLVPDDPSPLVKSFIQKIGAGLNGAGNSIATTVGGSVGPVIGGAIGAAAAPVVVSALGSALSAGAGAGVLGAGIAVLVKNDKAIQTAGADAGKRFMTALGERAKTLRGPVIEAMGVLEDASIRIVDRIGDAWDKLGPSVVPLTKDITYAVETITNALADIAGDSGPALEGLGDSLRLLADGADSLLRSLADGGPEAADNLRLLAGAIGDVLEQTGVFLNALNKLANNDFLTGPLLPLLRDHYKDVAEASDTAAESGKGIAQSMKDAASAANTEQAALTELSATLKAQTDPVFALLDAQNKLSEAQENVSQATKDHGKNSKEAKKALRDLAVAAIDLEGKAGALGGTFNGKLTPELKNTLRAAGVTEGQIRDLGRQFQSAQKKGQAFARNYHARASMSTGNFDAGYTRTVKKIRALDGRVIRVRTIMNTTGEYIPGQGTQTRAGGGPVTKNKPYWVGEQGPELIFPEENGRVLSAAESARTMRQRAGGSGGDMRRSGGGPQKLQLELIGQQEIVSMFRYLVRTANLLESA